jgi:hypothetical protein
MITCPRETLKLKCETGLVHQGSLEFAGGAGPWPLLGTLANLGLTGGLGSGRSALYTTCRAWAIWSLSGDKRT